MSKFIDTNTFGKLGTLTQTDADAAPFGIVKVDNNGKILLYNKYESELANVPIQTAVGKNFFTEVAICTNNRIFYGRFKEGMVTGDLDIAFNYVFTYKMKPTNVVIHLYHDKSSDTNWIFVKLR
ncbi:PAS domain-containing protein [Leptospira sp. 2 VSF19]|uniref:Photoactive yellow protein n=1 Tax=Leptospira soteropolitanensis TaxID=2950025 RepID=A0AAW5VEM2_9LEPT|nr:PAS domain-containing protein [Leptospira soteropolitanensis]MCW7492595.1 PAS domain-containing protein [Leptospira soteropolitanensis]MCW7500278.1 PAS domain-containing protein [Leptospira soteropolitanensis]MCW7522687.1 PAS domain-containing protein [Leptospira soteropolitanensis]MCW7526543.1 PAS domain-containing protein [Leptospira soteropolitanensis]MCW7530248.1 PAS domain-containing protein [Leptospira soteropolitanensis]